MRVVHVSLVRPRGRPEPEALLEAWPTLGAVAEAAAQAGAEVSVVQAFHRDARLQRGGVAYRFVAEPALPGAAGGFQPWRLAGAVAACAPDVIHVNGLDFPWHTRVLCGLGAPVLTQDHASTAGQGPALRRWGLAKVAAAAFTDPAQADPFIGCGELRADLPVFSIPESSTQFSPGDRAEARAATGLDGDPAVLWVGRLIPKKDPMTVLAAIERAAAVLPGLKLWCCFQADDLLAQVRARIAVSPLLAPRVRLLGARPHAQIETLCRAADIFMLASHFEGSGYALIEAMACGAAPVVSDIPSFRRLTGDGRVGVLAPVGDAETFAQGLITLAARPRDDLHARTIDHFHHELSFAAVGRKLIGAYTALLEARR